MRAADVIVVVSGTDGALASVVAGLVETPVVRQDTSRMWNCNNPEVPTLLLNPMMCFACRGYVSCSITVLLPHWLRNNVHNAAMLSIDVCSTVQTIWLGAMLSATSPETSPGSAASKDAMAQWELPLHLLVIANGIHGSRDQTNIRMWCDTVCLMLRELLPDWENFLACFVQTTCVPGSMPK